MSSDEARRILRAYRPDPGQSSDEAFAEALRAASQDPALAEWLKLEMAVDSEIRAKLDSIPVPASLRSRIVAPAPALRRPSWLRPMLALAAAAALLVTLSIAIIEARQRTRLAPWQTESLNTLSAVLSGAGRLDLESPNSAELRQWLKQKDSPDPVTLPASLDRLATVGCKTITVDGNAVSIICFHTSPTQLAHLVTVDERALAAPPPERQPRFVKNGEWATASWSGGGQSFMLAMKGSEPELRALLSS